MHKMIVHKNNFERIGNTPLVQINMTDFTKDKCFVKLEGQNPTGSIKDRTALGIIKKEINEGRLVKGKTILDASSGSYACSLSYFGKMLGYRVKVVTGSKLTVEKKRFIEYFGAELISFGDFTIEGNIFCKQKILKKNRTKYCFLDQLHNWTNPEIHYETTGPEILKAIPDVNAIVFSLGSGGTLGGISKYIKKHKPDTKLIGVTAASKTKIPGTGAFSDGDYKTPFIQELFESNRLDLVPEIQMKDALKGVEYLKNQGFYVGIQTGAVYHGMKSALDNGLISGKIVMISGDSGWKNADSLIVP